MALDAACEDIPLGWQWIRGHSGNEFNEMCDRMTQAAIAEVRQGEPADGESRRASAGGLPLDLPFPP